MIKDLGKPIAYGRTSEIYSWDQEHVLKLFYDWVALESIENEARISRAIYESGLPVPEVGDTIRMNGRVGLIYQRVYGEASYKMVQRKPWNLPRYYKRAAELHVESIHAAFQLNCPRNDKFSKEISIRPRHFPAIGAQRY